MTDIKDEITLLIRRLHSSGRKTVADFTKALVDNREDIDQLIELGLPGCLAFGYVPGSKPGKIKRADPLTKQLVGVLLATLKERAGRIH